MFSLGFMYDMSNRLIGMIYKNKIKLASSYID